MTILFRFYALELVLVTCYLFNLFLPLVQAWQNNVDTELFAFVLSLGCCVWIGRLSIVTSSYHPHSCLRRCTSLGNWWRPWTLQISGCQYWYRHLSQNDSLELVDSHDRLPATEASSSTLSTRLSGENHLAKWSLLCQLLPKHICLWQGWKRCSIAARGV